MGKKKQCFEPAKGNRTVDLRPTQRGGTGMWLGNGEATGFESRSSSMVNLKVGV